MEKLNEGISFLIGKIWNTVQSDGHDRIVFENDEYEVVFYHSQDCCESVHIEDINGDLNDLVGCEILDASEESNSSKTAYGDEEWTFYKFQSTKGFVHVRWYGESNGYYSTRVDLTVWKK